MNNTSKEQSQEPEEDHPLPLQASKNIQSLQILFPCPLMSNDPEGTYRK